VKIEGHSIEVRINAEDPWTFLPSPGTITGYHAPGGPGIRIDSAVHEQAMVQPYYDSLVAKLIATAHDRPTAIKKMLWAVDQFVVEGIRTTLPLQRKLLAGAAFGESKFHTRYVDAWLKEHNAKED
jgi:acetyl-CoA carboxylase biotin carboxylase subunit